ncbi:MAG TPA: hypothetical protein VK054_05280, partial [Beutenbergiaceae bacterium]|nr:hypothetical protein [Beutenbergiaceae bacterium]
MWASLRTRVTAGAVVVFALMLVIIGLGVVQVVKSTLVSDAQRVAEVQARNLAVAAQVGQLPEVIDADAHGETLLQVVDAEGEVVGFSPTLVGMPALGDPLGNDDDGVATTIRVAHPSGGVDYRVVALPTSSPTGPITV